LPGKEREELGSYYLIDTEFQLGKMKKFWRWIVITVAKQQECISFY
jgi:hypothetical protein